jgi:hypothetical protein
MPSVFLGFTSPRQSVPSSRRSDATSSRRANATRLIHPASGPSFLRSAFCVPSGDARLRHNRDPQAFYAGPITQGPICVASSASFCGPLGSGSLMIGGASNYQPHMTSAAA